MAEGAISLIPWVENKVVKIGRAVEDKYCLMRRIQEYRQMQHWTRSSLRISTAFDWGHTCDLTEAINDAANYVLCMQGQSSRCWAFTSRTLVSRALGINIEQKLWTLMMEIIMRKASELRSERKQCRPPEYDPQKPFLDYFTSENIRFSDDMASSDNLRIETANSMVRLLESAYSLYHTGCLLERCCERGDGTARKRAQQLTSCQGMNAKLDRCSCEGILRERHLMMAKGFEEILRQWYIFVSSWDDIVQKASESFPFPKCPGISDLLFHDMATGFIASSAILRRGGRDSNRDGTTIVHPGERAAVVSSSCQILSMKESAVKKNGILRRWRAAATEFSEYALLRCDLVKRSRMTFREAVNDWESQYASWDRAPRTLSEWKGPPGDSRLVDDVRLVLLRQALGTEHSIDVYAGRNNECTVFGGYISTEPETMDRNSGKTVVIDCPLKLNLSVSCYHYRRVIDTWGVRERVFDESDSSLKHDKYILKTGRPGIYRLSDCEPSASEVALTGAPFSTSYPTSPPPQERVIETEEDVMLTGFQLSVFPVKLPPSVERIEMEDVMWIT